MLASNRALFTLAVTLGSLLTATLLVFGIDRATNGGEILGDVTVAGVELGGLGEFEATERIRALEQEMISTPIPVVVAGRTFALDPLEIGFEIDETAIVDAAMTNGREGNLLGQLGWWLGHFTGGGEAPLDAPYSYDSDALVGVMDRWQTTGIDDPADPGNVWIEDGAIVYSYPRAGTGIDMPPSIEALEAVLADMPRATVELQVTRLEPTFTSGDIDALIGEVEAVLAGPITLVAPLLDRTVTVPRRVLADALLVRRADDTVSGEPEFRLTMLGEPVLDYLAAFAPYLETDPADAQIVIDDVEDTVEIIPSTPVEEPDPVGVPMAAWSAANSPDRTAEIPYRVGRDAGLSTEVVESFGIKEKIGEFTTNHACCQNRVKNIQRIADLVDGAWILPGETFSLNDHVGKRTREKGFVCAGALIGGEIVEEGEICIGGGTSQFTTTLYNAAFFAGLEDVYHFPHTIWFSRYPEGREATLGFPSPDLTFKNNTDHVVVIKTSHTATSITVKMFGDNGGLLVEAGLSDRYRHTSPRKSTKADDSVEYCTTKVIQKGTPGWTVDVYRYITYPDDSQTTEVWTARYEGYWEITGYHPLTPPSYDTVADPLGLCGGDEEEPPPPPEDP